MSAVRGRKIGVENFLKMFLKYLSNTHQIWRLLPKSIGEQNSGKFCVKGITCCYDNRFFGAMFTQNLTF